MHGSNIKIALASLGVIGLAASHQANAFIAPASSGNSELVLVVVDSSTGESFYKDLGISSLPAKGIASFTQSVATDANYTQFLTDAGTHTLQYAVQGGGYTTNTNGSYDSTTGVTLNPTGPTNANVNQFKLWDQNITGPLNGTNPSDTNPAVNSSYLVVPGSATQPNTPAYTPASGLQTWNGKATFSTVQTVGTSQQFFNIAANTNGTFAKGTVTLLGSVQFASGVLTYTAAASAVPLPAAVWLLGSGLVGLMGIGRRRAAA